MQATGSPVSCREISKDDIQNNKIKLINNNKNDSQDKSMFLPSFKCISPEEINKLILTAEEINVIIKYSRKSQNSKLKNNNSVSNLKFSEINEKSSGTRKMIFWSSVDSFFRFCSPLVSTDYFIKDLFSGAAMPSRSCFRNVLPNSQVYQEVKSKVKKCSEVLRLMLRDPEVRKTYWEQVCRRAYNSDMNETVEIKNSQNSTSDRFNKATLYMEVISTTLFEALRNNQINRFNVASIIKSDLLGSDNSAHGLCTDMKIMAGLLLKLRMVHRGSLHPVEDVYTAHMFDMPARANTEQLKSSAARNDVKILFGQVYSATRNLRQKMDKTACSDFAPARPQAFDFQTENGIPLNIPLVDFNFKDKTATDKFIKDFVDDLFLENDPMTKRYHASLVTRELSKMQQAESMICLVRDYYAKHFGIFKMSQVRTEIVQRLLADPCRDSYWAMSYDDNYYSDCLWAFGVLPQGFNYKAIPKVASACSGTAQKAIVIELRAICKAMGADQVLQEELVKLKVPQGNIRSVSCSNAAEEKVMADLAKFSELNATFKNFKFDDNHAPVRSHFNVPIGLDAEALQSVRSL